MHSREAIIVALSIVLLTIIIVKTLIVEAAPTVCFFHAYNASFENNLNIYPYTSFSTTGSVDFTSDGFRNSCVNMSVTGGGSATLSTNLYVKGSFKMSFLMKTFYEETSVVFNFTRLRLQLYGSPSSLNIVLGRRSNGKIVLFKDGGFAEGIAMEPGKWYNITIELNASEDFLSISSNGSQLFSTSTGIAIHCLNSISLQIGIINANDSVKAYVDEFKMLVSPIIFTDKPIYSSSNSVTVRISGDQFPSSNMEISILKPDGSEIGRGTIANTNYNYSNISGFHGFSYSTNLSNPVPGTYTICVNGSGFGVKYHFGVWDTSRVWERKSSVTIKAGGFSQNSRVTLIVRNSTREIFSENLNVNERGEIDQNITVPVDFQLGNLTALLRYSRTSDFSSIGGVTDYIEVNVEKAVLHVTVFTNDSTYERVSPISIRAYVKYKDNSPIPWKSTVRLRLILIRNNSEKQSVSMEYTHDDSRDSYWSKTIRLSPSDECGNYLIKIEASDPYGNFGSGEKVITITPAKLVITLINQLEESYERSTKLNISVRVKYKDETPVDVKSSNVSLELTMGNRKIGPFPFTPIGPGQWAISHRISASEQTGKWDLKIAAVDDAGNTGDFSLGILIVPAKLVIETVKPINHNFSRTQNIQVNVTVRYPSYEPLPKENGLVSASLIHFEKGTILNKTLRFSPRGWNANLTIPKDAPLGNYVLRVSAKDTYGNYGYLNNSIQVSKTTLNVKIKDLENVYQIGFDTVRLKCVIEYLDGSLMDEGNVTVTLSSSTISTNITLKYSGGEWVGEYSLPVTAPTGDYVVSINAIDPYGNYGSATDTFRVSNLYIILIVISTAIALSVSVSILVLRRHKSRTYSIHMAEDYDLYG